MFATLVYSEINTLLDQLAAMETTPSSTVLYLDVFALFNNPTYFYDGTHPNGRGEQLLGNAIFAALVPDMPAVELRVASINPATRSLTFLVRSHGPDNVKIQASPKLTPGSWTDLVSSSLTRASGFRFPMFTPQASRAPGTSVRKGFETVWSREKRRKV